MSGRKKKGDGDQSQATLFSCWSAAKRTCSQETEPLQSHIIMDEPENFVPPETSGESTSVAAPILHEAEDDVQEDPFSILNEQASGQPDPPFADTTESLTRTAEPGPRRRDIGSILKPSMISDEAALATEDAIQFKRSIEQPGVNEDKRRRIKENRHIVKCAAEAVLY